MKTISTEQEKNTEVLEQLQEYAHLYFDAIIEANTTDGECKLKIGKYSARELVSMDRDYELPRDTMFDEDITIEAGSFRCTIQYRQIFYILAKWEQMMRAGKQKAVFEVGEAEEKSAKVLLYDAEELRGYKEKRIKLQRIAGNWWMPRKVKRGESMIKLYYELNGVFFVPGKWFNEGDLQDDATKKWCAGFGDDKIIELFRQFFANQTEAKSYGYFSEVARRANIKEEAEPAATATETAQILTETAETVDCATEGKTAQETANLRIWRFSKMDYAKIIVGDYSQGKVVAILSHVSGKSYIEISNDVANIHTVGTKELSIAKPITELTDAEVYDIIYSWSPKPPTNAPQPTEEPQTAANIGREPEGREAICRIAPNWAAKKVLKYGYTLFCFNLYPNGEFSVSVENKNGCRILTKDEFRKLCIEPTQPPKTPQGAADMPQFFNCEQQTIEDFKKMPNISKLAKAGIIVNGVGWHTEYLNSSHEILARVDNLTWDADRHDFPYQGIGVFGKTELYDNWKDAVIATIDALTDHLKQNACDSQTAYKQPYNIKYFIDKYGDIETLGRTYYDAVMLLVKERFKYKDNKRKGGRFRKKRIAELTDKINGLQQEYEQIRRAMVQYFKDSPPQYARSPHTNNAYFRQIQQEVYTRYSA